MKRVKFSRIKHLVLVVLFAELFISFKSDHVAKTPKIKNVYAASILTISNISTSTTITAITITYTAPFHIPSSFTITQTISPGNSYTIDLGNIGEYIYVDLSLSNSSSGRIHVSERNNPAYCPTLACDIFSYSTTATTYFYMYSPRWLYLGNLVDCVC